jgi:hypothetical protein
MYRNLKTTALFLAVKIAVLLAFFSVVETEKHRMERDQGSMGDVEAQ